MTCSSDLHQKKQQALELPWTTTLPPGLVRVLLEPTLRRLGGGGVAMDRATRAKKVHKTISMHA